MLSAADLRSSEWRVHKHASFAGPITELPDLGLRVSFYDPFVDWGSVACTTYRFLVDDGRIYLGDGTATLVVAVDPDPRLTAAERTAEAVFATSDGITATVDADELILRGNGHTLWLTRVVDQSA